MTKWEKEVVFCPSKMWLKKLKGTASVFRDWPMGSSAFILFFVIIDAHFRFFIYIVSNEKY